MSLLTEEMVRILCVEWDRNPLPRPAHGDMTKWRDVKRLQGERALGAVLEHLRTDGREALIQQINAGFDTLTVDDMAKKNGMAEAIATALVGEAER